MDATDDSVDGDLLSPVPTSHAAPALPRTAVARSGNPIGAALLPARSATAIAASGFIDFTDFSNSIDRPLLQGATVATTKREIAFIDRNVDDLITLLAGIRPDVEPILLSDDEPAPRQMARAVKGRPGLDAIHVIAHGGPGEVSFGAGALSLDSLDEYAAELAEVGQMLRDGVFNLWSCRTAQGEHGAAFVDALGRASGAQVAASTQLVGAAVLGGTWQLERSSERLVRAPLSEAGLEIYGSVMAVKIKSATISSISTDTGASSTDFITDDPTLTISGQVNTTGGSGTDTLDIFLVGGAFGAGTLVGTVTVSASGNWSFDLTTSSVLAAQKSS